MAKNASFQWGHFTENYALSTGGAGDCHGGSHHGKPKHKSLTAIRPCPKSDFTSKWRAQTAWEPLQAEVPCENLIDATCAKGGAKRPGARRKPQTPLWQSTLGGITSQAHAKLASAGDFCLKCHTEV